MGLDHVTLQEGGGFTRHDILSARQHDTPDVRRKAALQYRASRLTGRTCPTCGYSLEGAHKNRQFCSLACSADTHTSTRKWDDR